MSIDQMQAYYSKRAVEYDESMGYNNASVMAALEPIITEIKELTRHRNVLELACGPGFWTGHISKVAAFIKATDYNQSTLDQAIKKDLPWDKVSLQQADAYDLGAITCEFDMITAVDWLAHVPLSRMNTFLKGVYERLPFGSPVVFIDQLPAAHSVTGVFDEGGNHIQNRTLENGEVFQVIKHFFSDEDYHKLFNTYFTEIIVKKFQPCGRVLVCAKSKL